MTPRRRSLVTCLPLLSLALGCGGEREDELTSPVIVAPRTRPTTAGSDITAPRPGLMRAQDRQLPALNRYENDSVIEIPDGDDRVGAVSTIEIADDFPIGSFQVEIGATGTRAGDLIFRLSHGTSSYLLYHDRDDNETQLSRTIDLGLLLRGESVRGTWKLWAVDMIEEEPDDEGTLPSAPRVTRFAITTQRDDGNYKPRTFGAIEGRAIPDGDTHGLTSTIEVPERGRLGLVSVRLDIGYPFIARALASDLVVTLEHDGVTHTLHNRTTRELLGTISTSAFAGSPAAGAWTLTVYDLGGNAEGALNSWGLDL